MFAIRSLGYRTDLTCVAFDGEPIDRGDYIVVRSPQNPTYCQTLVYEVSRRALAWGLATLVMVADPDYHAARIYESLGFAVAEQQMGLELEPPGA